MTVLTDLGTLLTAGAVGIFVGCVAYVLLAVLIDVYEEGEDGD